MAGLPKNEWPGYQTTNAQSLYERIDPEDVVVFLEVVPRRRVR